MLKLIVNLAGHVFLTFLVYRCLQLSFTDLCKHGRKCSHFGQFHRSSHYPATYSIYRPMYIIQYPLSCDFVQSIKVEKDVMIWHSATHRHWLGAQNAHRPCHTTQWRSPEGIFLGRVEQWVFIILLAVAVQLRCCEVILLLARPSSKCV